MAHPVNKKRGSPSARQRNAIQMAFRWPADEGPDTVVLVEQTEKACEMKLVPDLTVAPNLIRDYSFGF